MILRNSSSTTSTLPIFHWVSLCPCVWVSFARPVWLLPSHWTSLAPQWLKRRPRFPLPDLYPGTWVHPALSWKSEWHWPIALHWLVCCHDSCKEWILAHSHTISLNQYYQLKNPIIMHIASCILHYAYHDAYTSIMHIARSIFLCILLCMMHITWCILHDAYCMM